MKRLFTLLSLALILVIANRQTALASHAAGAQITWRYAGTPNTYVVTVKFYRDCAGITALPSVDVCYNSVSCGMSGMQNAPEISVSVLPNPPCTSIPINCANGIGIEEHIYETTITLPGACVDWEFSFSECCRNNAINTINGAAGYNIYVSSKMDNLNFPTDDSPEFQTVPYTQFCVGNPFYFDQFTTDLNGDSIVYSIVAPQNGNCGGGGTDINTYNQQPFPILPLTATQPVWSTLPVTISQQGVIFFLPTLQQVAVFAVLVEEFEPGTGLWKGSVKRDIQINVTNLCNTIIPSFPLGVGGGPFTNPNATGIPGSCGDFNITVPFGVEFQCGSVVPSDFRVMDPFGFANPVVAVSPINCSNGKTDSVQVTVLHSLTAGTSLIWTKAGSDGNTLLSECGQSQPEDDTIQVKVTDQSTWAPAVDSIGCLFNSVTVDLSENVFCFSITADGTDITMIDGATNTPVPVAAAYGYCGPAGDRTNQMLIVMNGQQSVVGPVYVMASGLGTDNNTLANDCGRFLNTGDTIAILYVNNTIPVALGSDPTVCDGQLPFVLNSGYSTPATFVWDDVNGPIAGATNPTYDATAAGTYIVHVNSSPTCFGSDTININVLTTPAPGLGPDTTFCNGAPTLPLLNSNENNPSYAYAWFFAPVGSSNPPSLILLANQPTYQPAPNQYGTYVVEVGNGQQCFGYDTLHIFSVQPPVNNLTSQSLCVNQPLPLLDAGNPGAASYQWSAGGVAIPGATSQTYQVTNGAAGSTVYSVDIASGGVCNGSFNMTLTISPIPVVNVADATECVGTTSVVLDAGNSGTNATYQWFDNNGPISGATNQTYTPAQTTSGIYNYSVTVTNPGGCSASDALVYTVSPSPTVTVSDDAMCETDPAIIFDAGNAGSSFQWSTGETTQTITTNTGGVYTVTVTNAQGCTATDNATLGVEALLAAPVISCLPGDGTYKFIYRWPAIAGAASYEVSIDGGLTWTATSPVGGDAASHGTNDLIPNLIIRGLNMPTALCINGRASEPVACAPVLPNIITANGDNKNDEFIITNIEFYPNNLLTIFNRWGQEVYSQSKYNNKDNVFKGDDLPEGTYFVILDLGDGREAITGTLTISK